MEEKRKKLIKLSVYIIIGLIIYSWINVRGSEIKGVKEITPECTVKVRVGREQQKEYVLNGEQIIMLKNLILKSSFRRVFSSLIYYPAGTEKYVIMIDWNNQQDFINIHCTGNEYISIPDQFDGSSLKIKNKQWEPTLREILSLSE